MYLDFESFVQMGGDRNLEPHYERLEFRACRLIDQMTHGRIAGEDPVRACVKYCVCELVSAMHAAEQIEAAAGREIGAVTGMSNDGVSVTYAKGSADSSGGDARYVQMVRRWLIGETTEDGVNILYAGVDA